MSGEKRRASACVVGVAAAAALAAGCGSSDGADASSGSGGGGKAPKIAFVSFSYTDFNQAEEKGLKAVAASKGGSVRTFNANFDPQKLLKQCQDAATSGRYNVIVLEPQDGPTGVPCAAAAKAANIPVVVLDNAVGTKADDLEPQVPGVVGSVLLTPTGNADNMVAIATDACAGADPCKVIGEVITANDPFTNEVIKRAKAEIPGIEFLQTIASNYDPSVIAKTMPDVLSAHPDADVYLSIADSQALAAIPALKAAKLQSKVKLVGNGGSRLGVKAIADGTLFASAGNWPEQQGKLAAGMAAKAVAGEKIADPGVDALTISKPRLLTKGTVGQFTPEWGAE